MVFIIDVSIIIVSYNSISEILVNVESIKHNITSLNYEILIVNNSVSDIKLSAALEGLENVRVLEANENLGFGKANNLGLEKAQGKYILFVNPDVIFLSDIKQLTDALDRDTGIGLIGPVTYDVGMNILQSCGEYPCIKNFISDNLFLNNIFPRVKWWGNFSMKYFDYKGSREVDWISGAFMLGRKSVLSQVGGFDKDFFMYCEDIDICWRLKKAGFKIIFSDKVSIIHSCGHSVGRKSVGQARMIADGSRVLWSKHYSFGTVKKLFAILCLGSILRRILWKALSLAGVSVQKGMDAYYKTIISKSINFIKGNEKYEQY